MVRKHASVIVQKLIGEGRTTNLWLEPWTGRGILLQQFPHELLFHPVCNKKAIMANIINEGQWAILDHVRGLVPKICEDIEAIEIGTEVDEWV